MVFTPKPFQITYNHINNKKNITTTDNNFQNICGSVLCKADCLRAKKYQSFNFVIVLYTLLRTLSHYKWRCLYMQAIWCVLPSFQINLRYTVREKYSTRFRRKADGQNHSDRHWFSFTFSGFPARHKLNHPQGFPFRGRKLVHIFVPNSGPINIPQSIDYKL